MRTEEVKKGKDMAISSFSKRVLLSLPIVLISSSIALASKNVDIHNCSGSTSAINAETKTQSCDSDGGTGCEVENNKYSENNLTAGSRIKLRCNDKCTVKITATDTGTEKKETNYTHKNLYVKVDGTDIYADENSSTCD